MRLGFSAAKMKPLSAMVYIKRHIFQVLFEDSFGRPAVKLVCKNHIHHKIAHGLLVRLVPELLQLPHPLEGFWVAGNQLVAVADEAFYHAVVGGSVGLGEEGQWNNE